MKRTHKYKVTVDVLYVRESASKNSKAYKKLYKNNTFKADSYIDSNGYRWLVVKYKNSKGVYQKYFVAESTLKNKKSKYIKDIS